MRHVLALLGLLCAGAVNAATMPLPIVVAPASGGGGSTVEKPGLSAALSASPPYTCLANHYVDINAGNDSNPGTQAAPWKTIQNADNWGSNVPKAGDCVNVLPGTYPISQMLTLHTGGNSNSATGFVVYRSTVPQGAHLIAATGLNGIGDVVQLWTGYLLLDGFEIDGNKAQTQGSGIDGCVGGGGNSNIAHHFTAINNYIHDVGGSGLSSCTTDFITWRHNLIMNCASTNIYQESGLNLFGPRTMAAGTYTPTAADSGPYGIQMLYNVIHNCQEMFSGSHTDGNGIILDSFYANQSTPTGGYLGNTLVDHNIAYSNGGGGIQGFLSKNVTISNNTAYNNHLDTSNSSTARGEINLIGSATTNVTGNITEAVVGSGVLANNSAYQISGGTFPSSGTVSGNFGLGGKVSISGVTMTDPQFVSPTTGDFALKSGSPATGAGACDPSLTTCP
jgi:parallel beta-helix repeat protein